MCPMWVIMQIKTAFTRCRHILNTMKKVTVAKFELAFTRCRHNLKTVGNLTIKTRCRIWCQRIVPMYTLRIDLSRSKSVEKCSVFIFVECLHDAVSNLCRLWLRFQNLPFSKSAGKNVPFSCEWEAYPSNFHRFQNVPASCERSLKTLLWSVLQVFADLWHKTGKA